MVLGHREKVSVLETGLEGEGHARALELLLTGVSRQLLLSKTISVPSTTIGVRVIVHVSMKVPISLRPKREDEISKKKKQATGISVLT